MKKIMTLLLTVILCFGACACGGNSERGENVDMTKVTQESARAYTELVNSKYFVKLGGYDDYFKDSYPTASGEKSSAFLWGYFGALGMQYRFLKLFPQDAKIKADYKLMLDGMKNYRKPIDETKVKYGSERGQYPNFGQSDVFFDDNIWVARNLLYAYEIFNEQYYLDEAKMVTNYIYTGWNEKLGGLVWNENGLGANGTEQENERGLSANACGIIVNAMLYNITKEESYLNWANKFYDFCKRMQDPVTFIYYNGIHTIVNGENRQDGQINKALYSYNPGSMLLANKLLYDITKDEKYITDIKRTAVASHEAFMMTNLANSIDYYHDYVWFTAIMMEGFYEVRDIVDVSEYVKVFENSLCYGLKNLRNDDGLLPHNYAVEKGVTLDDRSLLTQSGLSEIMCLISMYNGK